MMKKPLLILMAILFIAGCAKASVVDVKKEVENEKTANSNAEIIEENGQRIYVNYKFKFKVQLLPTFQDIEYLPDDMGMFMRHDASAEVYEKQAKRMDYYSVEIGITALENFLEESDLSNYVLDKYPGYSMEFFGSGLFIDERDGEQAVRHYFLMSSDKKYIHEAYLKVPAFHYTLHKGGFDDFVKTIELF